MFRNDFLHHAEFVERFADHDECRKACELHSGGLRNEWHRTARSRVRFENINHRCRVGAQPRDGELDVHQSLHLQRTRQFHGLHLDLVDHRLRQAVRRQNARGVAGVNPRFLDVLHHAADDRPRAIAEAIDVDFGRVFEELIDQHRLARRHIDRVFHVAFECFIGIHDLHRATAENEAGSHDHRVADLAAAR